MNKKLIQFASENNLICSANAIYGKYNDYPITINFGGALSATFTVSFSVHFKDKLNELIAFLEAQKSALKYIQIAIDGCSLYCIFQNMTYGGSIKKITNILNVVTGFLKDKGIAGDLCPYCGQPMETPTLVNDRVSTFYAHEACFEERVGMVTELEATEESKPNNYLKGTLGAILGALAGGVVFCALYFLGFLASISSFVGAFAGSFLYSKFGGKNNKLKIVIVALSTLVVTVLAFGLSYTMDVATLLSDLGIQASAVEVLFELIQNDPDVAQAFWSDLITTLLFYVLGVAFVIITMYNQQKKASSTMKKMN